MKGWGGSCCDGWVMEGCLMQGWGGSSRSEVGHVGWGLSCRGGVGWVM